MGYRAAVLRTYKGHTAAIRRHRYPNPTRRQWIVIAFDNDAAAIGMHTWYHGYLYPVFQEVVMSFDTAGYSVVVSDTKVDPLVEKLEKLHNSVSPAAWLAKLLS